MIRLILIFCILFSISEKGYACLPLPLPENPETYDQLIDKVENIYLAKVISANITEFVAEEPEKLPPNHKIPEKYRSAVVEYKDDEKTRKYFKEIREYKPITYKFELIEVIKGQAKNKNPELKGYQLHSERQVNHFNNHQDDEFWNEHIGRSTHHGSCGQDPAFSVGGRYLIFVSDKMHPKSYERINDGNKDKWLAYVRDRVNGSD